MTEQLTVWIRKLADNDGQAAQQVWEHYYAKLIRYAGKKLQNMPKRTVDEEDVTASAFESFFRGVEAGRFPQLNDREDLRKVLLSLTARTVCAYKRHHMAKKRGAGQVRGESVFTTSTHACTGSPILYRFDGLDPTAKRDKEQMSASAAKTCSLACKVRLLRSVF